MSCDTWKSSIKWRQQQSRGQTHITSPASQAKLKQVESWGLSDYTQIKSIMQSIIISALSTSAAECRYIILTWCFQIPPRLFSCHQNVVVALKLEIIHIYGKHWVWNFYNHIETLFLAGKWVPLSEMLTFNCTFSLTVITKTVWLMLGSDPG